MGRKKKMQKGIITDGDEEDRISILPESLIHHILSFLLMRDVVRTCLLSKQWRNIWKSVPVLNFGRKWRYHRDEFIEQSLIHYEGRKIKKLQIHLEYCSNDHHLEPLVRFAVNHCVEELDVGSNYYYEFPNQCLFECLELPLRVLKCSSLPTSVSFPSLTELHLRNFIFSDLDTSACPLLRVLTIECQRLQCDDLNIHAPNRKLRHLKITELCEADMFYMDANKCLTLYAPNLLCIELIVAFRRFYKLDISSVKTASLESTERDGTRTIHETRDDFSKSLVELLTNFTHVRSLKLSQTYIQILVYGEMIGLGIPSLSATCLELTTNLCPTVLVGIASLLRASRCIEQLTINMNYSTLPTAMIFKDHDIDAVKAWEPLELVLSTELHLNNILIQNYPGCLHNWSPCRRAPNMEKLLEYCDMEIKLVEVLLKSCKMLHKMNISIMKPPSQPLKFQLLDYLTKKLQVFPRDSRNAEVNVS